MEPSVQITTITGPPFIGILLSWGLFGVLSIQVYFYSRAFPDDRRALKCLVYGVYALEITQTCLLTGTAWNMFARGFGTLKELELVGTTWLSVVLIGGSVGILVQMFYVHCIAVISQTKVAVVPIVLISLTSFVGAVITAFYTKRASQFTDLLDRQSPAFAIMGLWFATGATCDVLILFCMCYFLWRRTRDIGFGTTRACICKVARLFIEAGALTACIAVIILALFYSATPITAGYCQAPMTIIGKVYSTSMLAILNSRMKLGTISESTTWQDNELRFALSHTCFENTGSIKDRTSIASAPC